MSRRPPANRGKPGRGGEAAAIFGNGRRLLEACREENEERVLRTLNFKHNMKAAEKFRDPETGMTILHWAVELGLLKVAVQLCRQIPAAPAAKDYKGYTPLHTAVKSGHVDAVRVILSTAHGKKSAREKEDIHINTPLHLAADGGSVDMIRLLLGTAEGRAAALMRNRYEDVPLHMAARYGHTEATKVLLEAESGKEAAQSLDYKRRTPRDLAQERGHNPVIRAIDDFLYGGTIRGDGAGEGDWNRRRDGERGRRKRAQSEDPQAAVRGGPSLESIKSRRETPSPTLGRARSYQSTIVRDYEQKRAEGDRASGARAPIWRPDSTQSLGADMLPGHHNERNDSPRPYLQRAESVQANFMTPEHAKPEEGKMANAPGSTTSLPLFTVMEDSQMATAPIQPAQQALPSASLRNSEHGSPAYGRKPGSTMSLAPGILEGNYRRTGMAPRPRGRKNEAKMERGGGKSRSNLYTSFMEMLKIRPYERSQKREERDRDVSGHDARSVSPAKVSLKRCEDLTIEAFTKWSNFILEQSRSSVREEDMDFLRERAIKLWNQKDFSEVAKRIENDVDKGHYSMKKEVDLYKYDETKEYFFTILHVYDPLWLRIGLETVLYGSEKLPIPPGSTAEVIKVGCQRMAANPDILAKYAHPNMPGYLLPAYDEALKKFTVKKFLQLVYFLDRAKEALLVPHDPCLFATDKNSGIKSSEDVVKTFSGDFLGGSGIIVQRLKFTGYELKHRQNVFHTVNFKVTDLTTDLRDGLLLARVLDQCIPNSNLMGRMKSVRKSNQEGMRNVKVLLAALRRNLPGNQITQEEALANGVINGNLNSTLDLVWHVIVCFHRLHSVDVSPELIRLRYSLAQGPYAHLAAEVPAVDWRMAMFRDLLEWARLVCAHYDVMVNNFSTSFANGRVLCLLVHHYRPELLGCGDSVGAPERDYFNLFADAVGELGGVPMLMCAVGCHSPDGRVIAALLMHLALRLIPKGGRMK